MFSPTWTRLHRCLERHGISRLPEVEGDKPKRKKFDTYPIGFFHIDLAEVRTAEGKLYLFVAIDRTSKFAVVELVEKADMRAAAAFLEALIEAVPYRIHTVLTDNGIHFADLPKNRGGLTARFRGHPFDRLCFVHGIEHRLTKPNHPWTNGQVERMNRTIKDAAVKRYFYDTHHQLKAHLTDFLRAYNFARRLKTLKGLTPYEYLCKLWTQAPDRFTLNPIHQMPGLNNQHGQSSNLRDRAFGTEGRRQMPRGNGPSTGQVSGQRRRSRSWQAEATDPSGAGFQDAEDRLCDHRGI